MTNERGRASGTITWLAGTERVDAPIKVGEDGPDRVVEWPGLGTLRVERDGKNPRFLPHPDAHPVAVEKTERGVAAALARHLAGMLSLHGSAVRIGERAIVCVGPSGAGKSSMGLSLCVDHGGELLADDMASLDFGKASVVVLPTERCHTLTDASLERYQTLISGATNWESKWVVAAPRVSSVPAPLAAIVSLVFDDTVASPRLQPLRGHALLRALLPCVARFPFLADPEVHLSDLARLQVLSARNLVFELRRPRNISEMSRSAERLIELALPFGSGPPSEERS